MLISLFTTVIIVYKMFYTLIHLYSIALFKGWLSELLWAKVHICRGGDLGENGPSPVLKSCAVTFFLYASTCWWPNLISSATLLWWFFLNANRPTVESCCQRCHIDWRWCDVKGAYLVPSCTVIIGSNRLASWDYRALVWTVVNDVQSCSLI